MTTAAAPPGQDASLRRPVAADHPPPGPRARRPRRNLTDGPIGKTLLLFALPLLTTNILQSLSGSINALWVSRALGETALAATSNANLVLFFLIGTVFGVSMAANILVAQAIGRGRVDQAKQAIGASVGFFTALAIGVSGTGFVLVRPILHAMGTPAEAFDLAVSYLQVIFAAMPVVFFFTFLTMTLRGAGDAGTPFWFMLLSVVLDAAFNPVLIMGLGPFPRMGIAGAATATLLSQSFSLLALLAWLYGRKHFLRLQRHELGLLWPDPAILRALMVKGIPMGLQMMVISASALILISLVNRHGSQSAAAYGVVAQLWTYVQMPALAIAAGVSSMAGQAVGAGLWPRLSGIARAGIVANLALTGALVAVVVGLQRPILAVFLPAHDGALEIAEHINTQATWAFLLFGVTFVLFGVVRSTGAVYAPLGILAFALLGVRTPFAWLLSPRLGADAIWWSLPVGMGTSLVLAAAYYRWGHWREAHMLDQPADQHAGPVQTGAQALT